MVNTWPGWENAGLIGEGSFGRVYRIRREEFGIVYEAALKVITIPGSQADVRAAYDEGMDGESVTRYFYSFVEDVVAEFALLAQLKGNSNIVSYEDHMVVQHEDEIGWDILIRMELLTALSQYVAEHPLGEADVIRLGMDMARALELCRKRGIVHRDVKPENIFVSEDGNFKLGDFGVARVAEKTISAMSKKGTYNYMAPEVYRGEAYGYGADLYSLGLVLYRFLNDNRTPFLPPYPEAIRYRDKEKALHDRMSGLEVPPPAHGSDALRRVVLKACAYCPKDRYPDAGALREALQALAAMGGHGEELRPHVDAGGHGEELRPHVVAGGYGEELRPHADAGGHGEKLRPHADAGGYGEELRPHTDAGGFRKEKRMSEAVEEFRQEISGENQQEGTWTEDGTDTTDTTGTIGVDWGGGRRRTGKAAHAEPDRKKAQGAAPDRRNRVEAQGAAPDRRNRVEAQETASAGMARGRVQETAGSGKCPEDGGAASEKRETGENLDRTVSAFAGRGKGIPVGAGKRPWYQNRLIGALALPLCVLVQCLFPQDPTYLNPADIVYASLHGSSMEYYYSNTHAGDSSGAAQNIHSFFLYLCLFAIAVGMALLWGKIWQEKSPKRRMAAGACFAFAWIALFWIRGTIWIMIVADTELVSGLLAAAAVFGITLFRQYRKGRKGKATVGRTAATWLFMYSVSSALSLLATISCMGWQEYHDGLSAIASALPYFRNAAVGKMAFLAILLPAMAGIAIKILIASKAMANRES